MENMQRNTQKWKNKRRAGEEEEEEEEEKKKGLHYAKKAYEMRIYQVEGWDLKLLKTECQIGSPYF